MFKNYVLSKEYLFLTLFLTLGFVGFSANGIKSSMLNAESKVYNSKLYFEKNQGQFGKNTALYFVKDQQVSLSFEQDGITINISNSEFSESNGTISNSQKLKLKFLSSNNAQLIPNKKANYFANYYNEFVPEGLTHIPNYEQLTYKNLYNGIDAIFTLENHSLKYEFHLAANADPSQIKMIWQNENNVKTQVALNEKNLRIHSGEIQLTDKHPISYTKEGNLIPSSFKIEDNVISFNIEKSNEPIVIDPKIDWSSYYGGSSNDRIYGSATDTNLNLYVVGVTASNSAISTTGSHQATYGSNSDAFIAKLNKQGVRQWATYYGGNAFDEARNIVLDNSGILYICGSTASSAAISTTGTHQTSKSGGQDAFLLKMNFDGIRTWGTYFGGNNDETAFGVAIHSSGDPVIVGQTESTNGIGTTGTFRNTAFGKIDGFLARFATTNGSRVFGTYVGGNDDDIMTAVACNSSGNIYVTGYTATTGLGTVTGSTTKFAGFDVINYDFSATGNRNWAAYFGHNNTDISTSIAVDKNGEIVVVGSSSSTVNIGFGFGIFQSIRAGGIDGFLLILRTDGRRRISSYYGETLNDQINDIYIDDSNVYHIAGFTQSAAPASNTDSMTTRNAISRRLAGNEDVFYAQFSNNLELRYGTKLGKSKTDEGFTISRPEKSGVVYIGGFTTSDTMATSNIHQTTRGGGEDGIIYKLRNIPCSIKPTPTFNNPDTLLCQRDVAIYKPILTSGHQYEWTVTGGTLLTPLKSDSAVVRWGTGTSGTIKLVELNTKDCEDSTFLNVSLRSIPTPTVNGKTATCVGNTDTFSTVNNASNLYSWFLTNPIGTISGSNTSSPNITWTDTGFTFISVVEINDAGCRDTFRDSIRVFPQPAVEIDGATEYCANEVVTFEAKGFDFSSYNWSVTNATIVSGANNAIVTLLLDNSGNATLNLIETTTQGCLSDTFASITVNPLPAALAGTDATICEDDQIIIGDNPVAGNTYSWTSIPAGFGSTTSQVTVSPNVTTIYILEETVTATGCKETDSVVIEVNPLPTFDVGSNQTICQGETISIGNTVNDPSYTYDWVSIPAGFSSTNGAENVSPSVTTTYILTATTPENCTDMDSVTITVNPLPTAQIEQDLSVCTDEIVTFRALNVDTNLVYNWSTVPGTQNANTTDNFQIVADQTMDIILTVINPLTGCEITDTASLQALPNPNPNINGITQTCVANINTYNVNAGAGHTYEWSFTKGVAVNGAGTNSITIEWTESGWEYLKILQTTPFGCFATDSIRITVLGAEDVSLGNDTSICLGAQVNLIAPTGFDTIIWSTGETTPIITVNQTSEVWITVVNSSGCSFSDTINIEVLSPPVMSLGNQLITFCQGDSFVLEPLGGPFASYLWLSDNSTDSFLVVRQTGNYRLLVANEAGCETLDEVTTLVQPATVLELGNDTSLCTDEPFRIFAAGKFSSYVWQDGTTGSFYDIDTSGKYYVTATNEFGCTISDTINVSLYPLDRPFIPNAFSPNRDLVNDVWKIPGLLPVPEFTLEVYSHWGMRVFETTDVNFTWDGIFNGKPLQDGVYIYVIRTKDCKGFDRIYKGYVNIFR